MPYLNYFLVLLPASILLTFIVKELALKFNIVDTPDSFRKIHKKPVPLLGGLAIFLLYFFTLFIFRDKLLVGDLELNHWLGFFFGALFLVIGGVLDDKYNLPARFQIIWPILASLSVILGGVSIDKITNPFGGLIYFSTFISSALIFIWVMGMTYTTKLLDGLDGLASGVSAIGALIIFLFTVSEKYYQPDIALASFVFFVILLGFLVFNFNPAKIFLGESGSLLLGYILGVLAIISGGKIAIALLVLGLPALDVLWTIVRRLILGKNPFKHSDRKHLHHRLIDLGLSQRQAVFFFYFFSLFFGLSALFLQSKGKFLALLSILVLMLVIIIGLYLLEKKKIKFNKEKLLLHICCAPCAYCFIPDMLLDKFDLVLYFYNSNIDTEDEYNKRLFFVKKLAKKYNLKLEIEPYNHNDWLEKVKGLESEPEMGVRCSVCYSDRLIKTVEKAKELNINCFYTSLLVSPYKDSERIKRISNNLALQNNISFLEIDFDQVALSRKSIKLAKQDEVYCQKYCACEFTKNH
jgi:UDP-GlcNAc:undecaprenyl-phosphate/decaprenyl-phosphate GlcNAc-1-phosphate transferase